MTEPTLDRGQTWRQYIAERMRRKDEIELLMQSAELHEIEGPDGLRDQLGQIRYELSAAIELSKLPYALGNDFEENAEPW